MKWLSFILLFAFGALCAFLILDAPEDPTKGTELGIAYTAAIVLFCCLSTTIVVDRPSDPS